MSDPDDAPTTATLEVSAEGAPGVESMPAFRLQVLSGPDAGAEHRPTGNRTLIGTHPSADVVLADDTVSRFHCELVIARRGVRLVDRDSRNGTRLGGVLIESAVLDRPTIFRVGRTDLRFEPLADPPALSIAAQERFGPLVGRSREMRLALATLAHAAQSRANVIIEGEPGTMKQLAAAAIHASSVRAERGFAIVGCADPPDQVELELFGREGGPVGALEFCDGGTLVLEDFGALDDRLQRRLARVLDTGTMRRLGSERDIPVDVRVIGTTARNVARDVNAGRFRVDLYASIAVLDVRLPPLRSCPEDIPLIVSGVIEERGAREHPAAAALLSEASLAALASRPWPGNTRELRAYVERAIERHGLEQGDAEGADGDLPPAIDTSRPLPAVRDQWTRWFERQYLRRLFAETGGNVAEVARRAGLDRAHVYRLLARHGVR